MEAVCGDCRVAAHTTSTISPTKTSGTTKKSRANAEWTIITEWSAYPWAGASEARGHDRLLGLWHDRRRRAGGRPGRRAARLRLAVDRGGIRLRRRDSAGLAGGRHVADQARSGHLPDPRAQRRDERDGRRHARQPVQRSADPRSWHFE